MSIREVSELLLSAAYTAVSLGVISVMRQFVFSTEG